MQCLRKLGVNDKVYVAMSSGVDSSTVAALLTQKLGKDRVHGVFMNNWSSTAKCAEADWRQVKTVASTLGIDCHRIDLEKDYWTHVFEPMISQYAQGFTPNPDVSCNRYVKFGSLVDHLKKYDPNFKWIATGHYVGSTQRNLICRPSYLRKDQSYYLSTVTRDQVEHALFPLESFTKPEVRELANKFNLSTADKKDSQGLCFVEQTEKSFEDFLSEYIEPRPGNIVLEDGTVVGRHNGLWSATIGQRASLSMPQSKPEFRGQWFFSAKNIDKNELVIVRGNDNQSLFHNTVECDDFFWHRKHYTNVWAQYRSLQDPIRVKSISGDKKVKVELSEKRRAIAPGQYLVLYSDNHEIVGSGIISCAY